ncbi:MAG TPA: pitrilysin family protein [Hydrogenophaga sp.]
MGAGRLAWALLLGSLMLSTPAWAALPIQHWTHTSGAQVYLVESTVIPMLDVQVQFDGGSRRDPTAQAGLASATAGMLSAGVAAVKGQPALDENQLSEAWVDLGAQFGAEASADRFTLALRTLTQPDLLEDAVALAARQMAAPAWSEAVWQRDRERMLASLKEAETQPGTHAGRAFAQAVYGDHPYGRETTAESLKAIGVADMRAFYRRHASACRAQVILVGAVDRPKADHIVRSLMSAWSSHACDPLPAVAQIKPLSQAVERRVPFDAAQAQVLIGQPGMRRDDPDHFAAFVGNYILGGGGFVSRLTTEVREKRGLSYSVYSYFNPGMHAGAFQIGLTTRPDQADEAIGVVREVVRDFVAQGPTAAELAAAKAYLVNSFALRIDSNRKLLGSVANMAWHGLPLDYLDTWVDHVQAVTLEDIQRTFQRVLQPEHMVTVVVGARPG